MVYGFIFFLVRKWIIHVVLGGENCRRLNFRDGRISVANWLRFYLSRHTVFFQRIFDFYVIF